MNRSTYRFTLDLQKHRSQMSIAVFVHDSAVRLYISLTDGGNPYLIEQGGRAVFYGTRPDDTPLCHNCMIDDTGRIIYDFNDQTASVEGITNCQIRIYGKDGELITAPKFSIVADERFVAYTDIESLEDSPLDALDNIQFAEVERVEAESARADAEKARADAEEAREIAEAERANAEAVRISNEEARLANEGHLQITVNAHTTTIAKNERRITNLEKQLPLSAIVTDDNVAYWKDIPENACPWVQVNYVGGMSYAENNVLKHTDIDRIVFSLYAYGEPNDIIIPETIRNIEGWGWGVNSKYHSRLTFAKKEFERMTHRLVLTGTETWYNTGTNTGTKRWQHPLSIKGVSVASGEVGNIICSHYETTTNNKTYGRRNGISTQGANFIIFDEAYEYATPDEWKAHLKQLYDSGTPIMVEYAIATPVITDISPYFDDIVVSGMSYPQPIKFDGFIYFPIEEGVGGGQFEFMNINYAEIAVPSSITYMLREV